jgi:hypothetical protein
MIGQQQLLSDFDELGASFVDVMDGKASSWRDSWSSD